MIRSDFSKTNKHPFQQQPDDFEIVRFKLNKNLLYTLN